MKINWMKYENKDHVLAWFLVEAMAPTDFKEFGDFDAESLDVELKVNGVEVQFVEPMEFLQTQLQDIEDRGRREGRSEAHTLIMDKLSDLLDISEDD